MIHLVCSGVRIQTHNILDMSVLPYHTPGLPHFEFNFYSKMFHERLGDFSNFWLWHRQFFLKDLFPFGNFLKLDYL